MLSTTSESETCAARKSAESRQCDPVDLAHLRRYTMGDVALEKEVLQLFLHQLPQTIRALRDASSDRDWMVAAHTLKGSCRAVGAWQVAHLAELAERQMANVDTATRHMTITSIEHAADEVRVYIGEAHPPA